MMKKMIGLMVLIGLVASVGMAADVMPVYLNVGTADAGAATGTTVTAKQKDSGIHKTIIVCADTPVAITFGGTGTNHVGGVKIYDFPEGRINVLGVTVASVIGAAASTNGGLTSAAGGDFSIGTALVTSVDLTTAAEIDLCPKTSIDPLSSTNSAALAASAQFDGTTTAKDVYVNFLIDSGDLTATSAITFDGTITITWQNLGDY